MASGKQFLTHINGLRGLAILAIVLYHLSPSLCPCGYFGVDVFLVISGYFLFRNDIPRLRDKNLRLRDYAARKLWRIVPPWMVVAVPVVLICLFYMPYVRNVTIAGTVGATAFGFANDYIAFSGSYFNPNVQQNPLMHLWYIGLTEQLYVLLPLLALLPARSGKAAVRAVLALVGVLSLLFCAYLNYGMLVPAWADTVNAINNDLIRPYYSVFTRLWEPLLGAAAAGISLAPAAGSAARIGRKLAGAAALLGFVAACYLCETGSALSLPAALAAALLILFAAEGPVARLLNLRPLQQLGSISFSLYLVHWPVIVIWQYFCFWNPGAWDMPGMALLSLPLAVLLYRGVETRCSKWPSRLGRRARLSLALIPHLLILPWSLCMTQATFMEQVLPSGIPEKVSGYTHRYFAGTVAGLGEDVDKDVFREGLHGLGGNKQAPLRFLILGDSHAWHLADGLDTACTDNGRLRGLYLNFSCVPAWNCRITLNQGKNIWERSQGEALMNWLSRRRDLRAVLISVHWWLRLQPEAITDWDGRAIAADDYRAAVEAGMIETCRRIAALGITPVILRDNPKFLGDDPYETALVYHGLNREIPDMAVTPEQHEANTAAECAMIERIIAAVPQVRVVDAAPAMFIGGRYPFRDEQGRFLYRDTNHVSVHGSKRIAERIMQELGELLVP